MEHGTLIAHAGATKVDRAFLKTLATPESTSTHQTIPHHQIVGSLEETLAFRKIQIVREEFAVTPDGMRMFGLLELNYEFNDVRFALGLRNANDKSMRLGMTVGYKVMICDNMAFSGDFTPVLKKHSKNFSLVDALSIGVDRMQRNFGPLKRSITDFKETPIDKMEAKAIIYDAFMEKKLFPQKLLPEVHKQYFYPVYQEFMERNLWAMSNAFTGAFKQLKPVQQFQATTKLTPFLNHYVMAF